MTKGIKGASRFGRRGTRKKDRYGDTLRLSGGEPRV